MGFLGRLLLGLEIRDRLQVRERVEITAKDCHLTVIHPQQGRLKGTLDLHNPRDGVETVLLEVHTQVTLLEAISLSPSQPSATPLRDWARYAKARRSRSWIVPGKPSFLNQGNRYRSLSIG